MNINNSNIDNNIFNINISMIQNRKSEYNNNNDNNINEEKSIINTISASDTEGLNNKNEFLEGEIINRVK